MTITESAPVTTPAAQRAHLMGGAYDLSPATSVDDALRLAGLDWEPELHDLFLVNGQPVPSHKAVVRSDSGSQLGVVGAKFQPVTNRQLAEFGSLLVDEIGIDWTAGGALNGGKLPFLQFKLPDGIQVAGQDVVDTYVLLSNGHAGNAAMRTTVMPSRLQCGNQVQYSRLHYATHVVRHSGDIAAKVEEARNVLELSTKYMREFESIANRLVDIDADLAFFEDFVDELIPMKPDAGPKTNTYLAKQRGVLRQNWSATETLDPELKATGWGALNVVTEVIDHSREFTQRGRNSPLAAERRTLSTWQGPGASLRDRAFDLLSTEIDEPGGIRQRARERQLLTVG